MTLKYCPQCGNQLNEGSAFCSECGCKLEQEDNSPEPVSASPSVSPPTTPPITPPPTPPPTTPVSTPQAPPPEVKYESNSFSSKITDDTYNIHNQRAGYGLGIVIIMMIIAVIGYFVIEILK